MAKEKNIKQIMSRIREEDAIRKQELLDKELEAKAAKEAEEAKAAIETEDVDLEDLEEAEDESIKPQSKKKAKQSGRLAGMNFKPFFTFLGAALVVAGIVFIVFLNTPARRYERHLLKAELLYADGKYEDAEASYEKAIKIDTTSVEGYLGILNSKEARNATDVKDAFLNAIETFKEFDGNIREENKALITEYVLHEDGIFSDDMEARLEVLDEAYDITDGASDVERILTECVEDSVAEKRNLGEFDEAIDLVDKYAEKTEIDSVNITSELSAEKETYELKVSLLSKVYDALEGFYSSVSGENTTSEESDTSSRNAGADPFSTDFSAMMAIDGSQEAEKLVGTWASASYIYIPSENYNEGSGVGTGLYTFGEFYEKSEGIVSVPYYFYIGEFKDGVKEGFGVSFMKTGDESYIIYAGEWKNDEPDGKGTRYDLVKGTVGVGYKRVLSGDWSHGLANGEMNTTIVSDAWEGVTFTGTVMLAEGDGTAIPTESDEYVVQNLRGDKLIGVLASDTDGYALMYTLWQKGGALIDALGIEGH